MRPHWREGVLLVTLFLPLIALVTAAEPIAQDPGYHRFADSREWLRIPNAWNVLSNIPFLVVGFLGMRHVWVTPSLAARWSWGALFGGVALVCFGSGYFHWSPSNQTLVWDRIPMTVGFMGLFVALLSEHIDRQIEKVLLVPALLVGVGSVLWWAYSGDLRLYVWVQFGPLLSIPVLVLLFKGRFTHRHYLLYGLGFYVAAKLAEHWDAQIYNASIQWMGGHALKHILAACAPLCVLRMLQVRRGAGLKQP